MNVLMQLLSGMIGFVRRNPLTCLLVLLLAVAAPSVLVGIANFIFYFMLGILLLGVIVVLVLRARLERLRREMGGRNAYGARSRTDRSTRGGAEGDVRVYRTDDAPEKRVSDRVGEYVDYEEVGEKRD